jgi:hypothetical protein
MKKVFLWTVLAGLTGSCAVTKNETTISAYRGQQGTEQSALVYGLPQTRLFFEVDLTKIVVKKGPYAEYAGRMLGLQNVPLKDSETWKIESVKIRDRQEVDNTCLYTLSFIDYPQNIDKLLRFSKEGLILDVTADNVLTNNRYTGKENEDFQFMNAAVKMTTIEKVDTVFKTVPTDTAFVRIPVLQRKVLGKTAEEQAREAAAQIFNIRQSRLDILTANIDHPYAEGPALKLILNELDTQEERLLSLFNGVTVESHYVNTYSVVPEKPGTTATLFYFSDRAGVVGKNTAGAKEVWYEIGKIPAPASGVRDQQTSNVVYYRIPQIVDISAGVDKNLLITSPKTVYQFGNTVSFPLLIPEKKK